MKWFAHNSYNWLSVAIMLLTLMGICILANIIHADTDKGFFYGSNNENQHIYMEQKFLLASKENNFTHLEV